MNSGQQNAKNIQQRFDPRRRFLLEKFPFSLGEPEIMMRVKFRDAKFADCL
jgi:hypothetical protein